MLARAWPWPAGAPFTKSCRSSPAWRPSARLNYVRRKLAKSRLDAGLAEQILGLITHPDHSDFFGADSQAEVSIGSIRPDGQRVTERIDRLVVRDNDILVLDYKTDWNVPDKLEADHPHVMQLAGYARTLGRAYEGKPVRAAILWTSLPRLDWIADDTLRKAISGMAAIT